MIEQHPSPFDQLKSEVNLLMQEMEAGYSNACKMSIKDSYRSFRELDYPEETWEALAQEMKAERWPTQD